MDKVTIHARDMKVGDIVIYYGTPVVITRKVRSHLDFYSFWLSYISVNDRTVKSFQSLSRGDSQTDAIIL